jgi:hypothetical protein
MSKAQQYVKKLINFQTSHLIDVSLIAGAVAAWPWPPRL